MWPGHLFLLVATSLQASPTYAATTFNLPLLQETLEIIGGDLFAGITNMLNGGGFKGLTTMKGLGKKFLNDRASEQTGGVEEEHATIGADNLLQEEESTPDIAGVDTKKSPNGQDDPNATADEDDQENNEGAQDGDVPDKDIPTQKDLEEKKTLAQENSESEELQESEESDDDDLYFSESAQNSDEDAISPDNRVKLKDSEEELKNKPISVEVDESKDTNDHTNTEGQPERDDNTQKGSNMSPQNTEKDKQPQNLSSTVSGQLKDATTEKIKEGVGAALAVENITVKDIQENKETTFNSKKTETVEISKEPENSGNINIIKVQEIKNDESKKLEKEPPSVEETKTKAKVIPSSDGEIGKKESTIMDPKKIINVQIIMDKNEKEKVTEEESNSSVIEGNEEKQKNDKVVESSEEEIVKKKHSGMYLKKFLNMQTHNDKKDNEKPSEEESNSSILEEGAEKLSNGKYLKKFLNIDTTVNEKERRRTADDESGMSGQDEEGGSSDNNQDDEEEHSSHNDDAKSLASVFVNLAAEKLLKNLKGLQF